MQHQVKKHSQPLIFPLMLVLYEIATYLSNDMYLPALPEMMSVMSLNVQQAQLTLTIWFVGMATTPLIFGAISDRYGRRPVLLTGGAVFIVTSVICSISNNYHVIMFARLIQGCGIPSMMVAGYASVHELYEHKAAIRILALMASVSVLAPAFGPLLGSFILLVGNWHDIFWVIAIWSAIAVGMLYKVMPETHAVDKQVPIHFKTLFAHYVNVVTNKKYMLLLFILATQFGGFVVWITVSSFLIIDAFHYSTVVYGLIQAFIFIFYIIGNHSVDFLIERIGTKALIKLGLMLVLIGGVLIILMACLYPNSLYPYVLAMTIYSFGSSLCFAPLNRLTIEASDVPMGIRVSIFTVVVMLSLAFITAIAGVVYNGSIMSLAIPTTICALLSYLLYRYSVTSALFNG
jgi:Bcr/CflA subfamily drug resistance transporter